MAFLKTRVATFYDKEILKYPTGLEATRNVVIDGTTVPVDATSGRYVCQAGTLLVKNAGQSSIATVQTVTLAFAAASGVYQIEAPPAIGGAGGPGTSAPIKYNATAAEMQEALEQMPDIGAGNVEVTGPAHVSANNVYTITFKGALAGIPIAAMSVINSTVNTGAPTVAVTTAGRSIIGTGKVSPAASSGVEAGNIVGILTHTVEFFYPVEPNITDEPAAAYFHECIFDSTKLINVSGNLSAVQSALFTCRFE